MVKKTKNASKTVKVKAHIRSAPEGRFSMEIPPQKPKTAMQASDSNEDNKER